MKKNKEDWEVVVINPEALENASVKWMEMVWESYKNSSRFNEDMKSLQSISE